jgi:regulator of cell morphogenesis and NO signaling
MNSASSLADIAIAHPAASRVFHRYGLDYCCGGRRTLEDACVAAGLDPGSVLASITSADASAAEAAPVRWADQPLPALVDFIVGHYHRGLREELPELIAMAARVESRHGEKATCPTGLRAHLESVYAAVLDHLRKEEQILFPMIAGGAGARVASPVHVMEVEHDDHRVNLARTRELTANLVAPEEACTTWRALYLRLEQLEADLMEHIHLENNVLFPRALGQGA